MWGRREHSVASAIAGSKEWKKRLPETARRESCVERVTSQGGARELINHLASFPFFLCPSHWGFPLVKPNCTSQIRAVIHVVLYRGASSADSRREKVERTKRGNVGYSASQGLHWAWGYDTNKSAWRTLQTNLFFYVSSDNERKGKGFIMKGKSV